MGDQGFIRTQTGCDKFCAFCVVPHVRGPEQAHALRSELANPTSTFTAEEVEKERSRQ